jgi:hypothetical protein
MKSGYRSITVRTYAGYRADERPVEFSVDTDTLRVREIVDRWYDPDCNYFRVLADDGAVYLIRYDLDADGWQLAEKKHGKET